MSSTRINQSRRGFFTGSLLTQEGREKVNRQVNRLGLFPPGLKPVSSTENCADCTAFCVHSCPQKIIKSHPESHYLKGQPFIDFRNNGCTFCYQCNEACPQLKSGEPVEKSLGKADLNPQKCYAWTGVICMSCISVCSDHLIKFDKSRKPSIQLEACTGCGCCIKVCPATAISIIADSKT